MRRPALPAAALLAATLASASASAAQTPSSGLFEALPEGLVSRVRELDPDGRIVERGHGVAPVARDEIADEDRARIQAELDANRARLVSEGKLATFPEKALTNFAWPLRQAAGRTDFEFHG